MVRARKLHKKMQTRDDPIENPIPVVEKPGPGPVSPNDIRKPTSTTGYPRDQQNREQVVEDIIGEENGNDIDQQST